MRNLAFCVVKNDVTLEAHRAALERFGNVAAHAGKRSTFNSVI
jgi:hypothetical protein